MSARVDSSFFGIHEEILLTKNGVWLSNGEEITHTGTVLAFSRNLFRCKQGFEIRLGSEHKTIFVEDTLYFVARLEGSPTEGFMVELTDGRKVPLDPTTLKYQPGRLVCKVPHPNEGTREEAKFLSPAYYELLNHVEPSPEGDAFELWIQGSKIRLANC